MLLRIFIARLTRHRSRCTWLIAASLFALPTLAQEPAAPIHLKVVGGLASVTQFTKFERPFWQTEVPRITSGRVLAEIHPSDQSGFSGPDILQLMRLGVISFGTALLAQVAAEEPEFNVVDLPILNPDIETLYRTVSTFRGHIADILARRYNVQLLAIYAYPAQVLFCSREFNTFRDLKGRKVRTSSVGQSELMSALGATPIQLPFAQIVESIRQGVVDCAITGTRSGGEIGLPEVTSHISPLAISWGLSFFGTNRDTWNQLPADVREQLNQGIQKLEGAIWEAAGRETAAGLACATSSRECGDAKMYNMKLVPVDPADAVARKQLLVNSILPQWIQRCGQDCVEAWNTTLGPQLNIWIPPKPDGEQ